MADLKLNYRRYKVSPFNTTPEEPFSGEYEAWEDEQGETHVKHVDNLFEELENE